MNGKKQNTNQTPEKYLKSHNTQSMSSSFTEAKMVGMVRLRI
jgi:hypothetical protein